MSMTALEQRIMTNLPILNERQRRLYLSSEAIALGRGGIQEVSRISGVHRNTISAGVKELKDPERTLPDDVDTNMRIRKEGGGRKLITEKQPGLLEALDRLINPASYGNPMFVLRYTTKSLRLLAEELQKEGFSIHHSTVADLLRQLGYNPQQNHKTKQTGKEAAAREAQFRHINATSREYMDASQPVISLVCTQQKKRGNSTNGEAEDAPNGCPKPVVDHEIPLDTGKALSEEDVDITNNEGAVSVGLSSDTAVFAVNSIRTWWQTMGSQRYPDAERLYITAEDGGRTGSQCRLWKTQLQALANELAIPIEVSHLPLGTWKWNKIEHQMFSRITRNWGDRPSESLEVTVSLIASATTEKGLKSGCGAVFTKDGTGINISDEEPAGVNIVHNAFCGKWNYTVFPQS